MALLVSTGRMASRRQCIQQFPSSSIPSASLSAAARVAIAPRIAPRTAPRITPTAPSGVAGARYQSDIASRASSAPNNETNVTDGKCPYNPANNSAVGGAGGEGGAGVVGSMENVKLVNVPKLPIFGSILPAHSGIDKLELNKSYDWWYSNYAKFGNFYSIGMPSLGKGLTGETYVLTDPNEFMKILRKEGNFPFGAVITEWPFIKFYDDGMANKTSSAGCAAGRALFDQGPEWQRIRRFMQTDLLHPAAAKGYVPGMIRACQIASGGAPAHAHKISEYTAFCSFDLFSSVMYGEFPGLAGGQSSGELEEENSEFCKAGVSGLELVIPMCVNPLERLQNQLFNIQSDSYKKFDQYFGKAREIANRKLERFRQKKANGLLETEFEKNSYASLAIDRYLASKGEEGSLNEDDVGEIINVALIAALDTTSALLNWSIVHLAMNPHVQDELYKEITANIAANGKQGELTEECFSKLNNTYLDAFLRENHRLTPPIAINLTKENVTDQVEIHGTTIPKGSMCILDTRALGMDPNITPDPDTFDPSRWFEDQVEKRKGTRAEALDHPLYREPFSAGARKCPGSRVAGYEAKVLLSQLVLDWKITVKEGESGGRVQSWRDIKYFQGLTVQPEVPELCFERR